MYTNVGYWKEAVSHSYTRNSMAFSLNINRYNSSLAVYWEECLTRSFALNPVLRLGSLQEGPAVRGCLSQNRHAGKCATLTFRLASLRSYSILFKIVCCTYWCFPSSSYSNYSLESRNGNQSTEWRCIYILWIISMISDSISYWGWYGRHEAGYHYVSEMDKFLTCYTCKSMLQLMIN